MNRNGGAGDILLDQMTEDQRLAISSQARRLLVIAGAGSGKTDVMARRVAWWIRDQGVPKDSIAAFTFTEAAAEELRFRIRTYIDQVTPSGEQPNLGGMFIGTIHAFCLKLLRDLSPEIYYNYDILDEAGRIALVQRGYHGVLGLPTYEHETGVGQFATIDQFLRAYDLLNEYDELSVTLPTPEAPSDVAQERDWIRQAVLETDIGTGALAQAFAVSAARLYAYMRARRFLDFSTSQTEATRLLRESPDLLALVRETWTHVVVDEVQDINPVQDGLIRTLVGDSGRLTAVGDHRQAIYAFRGSRVDLMALLHAELSEDPEGHVVELLSNFRSTPAIIDLANAWSQTIGVLGTLPSPEMTWGNTRRQVSSEAHVGLGQFGDRAEEAAWIASEISRMVDGAGRRGAAHDDAAGGRGVSYGDIALLTRSTTDVRAYQQALRQRGIPAVVRGGPDLFSQPEVLLFLSLFAEIAGIEQFYGNETRRRSLPWRIRDTLDCDPIPAEMIEAACEALADTGLTVRDDAPVRLMRLAAAIRRKMTLGGPVHLAAPALLCDDAVRWVRSPGRPRRIFPQQLYHWLLEEMQVCNWDNTEDTAQPVMFHLGQLSKLITAMETPGWSTADNLPFQVIALSMWGTRKARSEEAPLLVAPDAVTITTIHSAKGLQFAGVFLADVNAQRFPSSYSRRIESVPFEGPLGERINPELLADNVNYDGERRLMYVALTRAERYLYVSSSGNRRSRFQRQLQAICEDLEIPVQLHWDGCTDRYELLPQRARSEQRLATNFSDLRYFVECPHDFYLRKVLGFSPTIDQAFGYGRAVHNILREIHRNPRMWAEVANNEDALRQQLESLVHSGHFYLRYTTSDPLENMRATALQGLTDYVMTYQLELATMEFEPEREFEAMLPEEDLLVSGSIDLLRLDAPPRVAIIDFKSGEHGETRQSGLSDDLMQLQIGIYGVAARHELEYEPDTGLVRYIGESDPQRRETRIALNDDEIAAARERIVEAGRLIRQRAFGVAGVEDLGQRCAECDHKSICGRQP